MRLRYRRLQTGVALVLALALVVLLVGLAMTTFALVSGHAGALNREAQRTRAGYLAEAGIEIARRQLDQDPQWQGGRFEWGPGDIEVKVERDGGQTVVTSRAQLSSTAPAARPARAALKATLRNRWGRWQAVAWDWRPAFEENER